MAEKTIPELQLKSSVVGDESMPADNGIQTYRITPAQLHDYLRTRFVFGAQEISNLTLTTAVGSSALTIAVKTKAGADPSSSDPVRVGFRSATLTSGTFNARTITGALSLVISSGSTLGQVDGQPSRIWVYLIDNAGTLELAVSHKLFRDDELVSTTAEGGAGGADSATVMYSASARSSVPCRLVGYIDNTQTTAGTWASAGSQIQVFPFRQKKPTVQVFTSGSGTYYKPAGCVAIRVRLVGGGGGGSGSGSAAGNGNAGTDTTFGSLTGSGGSPGDGSNGGGGGAASGGDINIRGGNGGARPGNATSSYGGMGGSSFFGGAGAQGNNSPQAGSAAGANTGSGGGGAGCGGTANAGQGGGAGGYCEKLIIDPAASYSYGVGASGGGGGAGGSGAAGGAGGSGIIIVEEYY